jgi:hypothetical protein
MMSYSNSFKPRAKISADLPAQFLSGYPLEQNRKSIGNQPQPPKVTPLACRKTKFTVK